ncbi:four-carbon acid sugar kinase family protein [Serratia marcescens]|uniref:four-carbon acid sugar kinase family protein n=1 Tax=Serratia marcescens TaxID=615 RepID=UPI003FA72C79
MIAILADDLTSALDGAAPFAARGLNACVMLRLPDAALQGAEIVAFDLDSRFVSPEQAERRFRHAAACVKPARLIYKTVDSTLRGNLGPETRGALTGSGRRLAIVAPAFPDAGRTTVGGRQYVDGVVLEQTAFARDPKNPIVTGYVMERMAGLEPTRFQVFDAADNGELDEVVRWIGIAEPVVWVGSPGLAAALSRALSPKENAAPAQPPLRASKVLVAIGSLHPANDAQLASLRQAGAVLVTLPEAADPEAVAQEVRAAFARADVVCLMSPRSRAAAADHAAALGAVVSRCTPAFDGLVATGGDTARRIVDAMAAGSLTLFGEVEPGVPFGLLNLPGRRLPFATKAGGFGRAGTLLNCVTRLRADREGEER